VGTVQGVLTDHASVAAAVAVRGVVRRFGDVTAVDDVSLDVHPGEFLSLLGPSGCGKTTLLRIIAGLEYLDEGQVMVGGRDITRQPAHRRPVNMVFQRYALFPHKTVAENVAFGLRLRRVPRQEITRRVTEMLELVRLGGYGDRHIEQLSGGQAQRVALARALVNDPSVLLLDEPLAALDLKLRQAMHIELREIQRRIGSTFVYVTHDQEEALVMSDRIVLMDGGRIIQQGPPREVYDRPTTFFAATFLGEANLFAGTTRRLDGSVVVDAGPGLVMSLGSGAEAATGTSVRICVRPERITIGPGALPLETRPNTANGIVGKVIFLGSIVRYGVAVDGAELLVERPAAESAPLVEGDAVHVSWPDEACVAVAG
jgi:spermidine/putrescine transport system ATP-binding protein